MVCPHCQREIPDAAVYCGACGRRVVGWQGRPQAPHSEPLPGANEPTRRVSPDPRLLDAARTGALRTQKMAPDSHLLRVIRGDPGTTRVGAPSPSLLSRTHPSGDLPATSEPMAHDGATLPPTAGAETAAPAFEGPAGDGPETPECGLPGGVEPPQAGVPQQDVPDDPTEPVAPLAYGRPNGPGTSHGTAFYLEAALARRGRRVAALLVADVVLVVVGVYLIVSWARRPAVGAEPPSPGLPERRVGYVDWDDDPAGGRIATGPVHAAFAGPEDARGSVAPGPRREPPRAHRRAAAGRAQRPSPRDPPRRIPERPGRARGMLHPNSRERQRRFIAEVHRRVRRAQRDIRGCYRQVLALIHTVRGELEVELRVDADGRVAQARAARDTTRSTSLVSCILDVFRRLRFPRPPGGSVVLRYPFRFAPRTR